MIHISPAAAKEIKRIQLSRQQPDSQVLVTLKQGGCSGLIYQLKLVSQKNKQDIPSISSSQAEIPHILIDPQFSSLLQDLKIDFTEDLMGGSFRFINPQATDICTCGQSFRLLQSSD